MTNLMSRRHPNDVAWWVVFPWEQWEAERNRRSNRTRQSQATQLPEHTDCCLEGEPVWQESNMWWEVCCPEGRERRLHFSLGGWTSELQGEMGILFPLMPLVGGNSFLDSFGMFDACLSSMRVSWMAHVVGDAGTVLGSRRRSCDGGCWHNQSKRLYMLLHLWEWGEIAWDYWTMVIALLFTLKRKWIILLHRGPPQRILELVTSCEIHFLPAPAYYQAADIGLWGASMPSCSSAHVLFCKPLSTLLVSG